MPCGLVIIGGALTIMNDYVVSIRGYVGITFPSTYSVVVGSMVYRVVCVGPDRADIHGAIAFYGTIGSGIRTSAEEWHRKWLVPAIIADVRDVTIVDALTELLPLLIAAREARKYIAIRGDKILGSFPTVDEARKALLMGTFIMSIGANADDSPRVEESYC